MAAGIRTEYTKPETLEVLSPTSLSEQKDEIIETAFQRPFQLKRATSPARVYLQPSRTERQIYKEREKGIIRIEVMGSPLHEIQRRIDQLVQDIFGGYDIRYSQEEFEERIREHQKEWVELESLRHQAMKLSSRNLQVGPRTEKGEKKDKCCVIL